MSTTPGTRAVATRLAAAEIWAVNLIRERIGCTEQEAAEVLAVLKQCKLVTRDVSMSNYRAKHGAVWDADVLRRALVEATTTTTTERAS